MAIIKKNDSTNQSTNQPEKRNEPKPVDFSDKSLFAKGEKSKLDPTQDAFARTAPPPKGLYDVKLFLTKDTFKYGYRDEKDPESIWFVAEPECRIVSDDKDIDNYPVYPVKGIRLNTFIKRGKNISTMAAMIKLCGFKLEEEMTPGEVAQRLEKVLKTEPILRGCECDWEGWSKDDQRMAVTSMDNAPTDEDGNPMYSYTRTNSRGEKEEINCGLRVKVWGSKKGKTETATTGGKAVKPITIAKEEEEIEEKEEEKVEAPKPKTKEKGKEKDKDKPKSKPAPKVEEDEGEEEEIDDLEAAEEEDE